MNRLLAATAIVEASTGFALLVLPFIVIRLLLGSVTETMTLTAVGRVAGAALLALGIACWLARGDTQSDAARGLVAGMILYNVGAAGILGAVGISAQTGGIALWPAVLLHVVMAVWCVMSLVSKPASALR